MQARQSLKNLLIKYDTINVGKALIEAVAQGNKTDVSDLMFHNASIEEKNSDGKTALYLAMEKGNDEAASYMLEVDNNTKNYMNNRLIVFLVMQVSSPFSVIALKQVSFLHAVYAVKRELYFYKLLPQNSKEIFEKLSPPLKAIVHKRMFKVVFK